MWLKVSCPLRIWNTLTANYGHVMPVDWKRSRTRSLHVPTINLEEKPVSDPTSSGPSYLCLIFPFIPPPGSPPSNAKSLLRSSRKSQIFIVPGFSALIKFPPPALFLVRERQMSRWSCLTMRSSGIS